MSNTLTKSEFPSPPTIFLEGRERGPDSSSPQPLASRLLSWFLEGLAHLVRRPAPSLNLEMTDRFVRFRSMREFQFALVSRTEFPASRIPDLMARGPQELEAESAHIRDAERHLSNVLARSVKEPQLTGELFRELELKLFSADHGWREIIDGLKRLPPDFDEYKRVALIKYLQYLRARQFILRSAFIEKTRDDDEACLHATSTMASGAMFGQVHTAVFGGVPREPDDATLERGYQCLPKGETVSVDPGDARHMELLLAGNRMRLYTGRECYLVDDGNNTYPLQPGKNLVGRHRGCDVTLDAACKAISRTHLVIEPLTSGRVLITDLSSHGTDIAVTLPKPH